MLSKINVIPIIKYMTYTRLLCIKSCKGMVKKLICVYAWGGSTKWPAYFMYAVQQRVTNLILCPLHTHGERSCVHHCKS